MMKNRLLLLCLIIVAGLFVWTAGSANASTLVPQTAVPGVCVPKWAVPLPVFGPAGPIPRVNAAKNPNLTVTMKEIDQVVLPQGTFPCAPLGAPVTFGPTRVWAYETTDTLTGNLLGPANWPAVTIDAKRYKPTQVKYVNKLPTFNPSNPTGPGLVQGLISVDQTIDRADPTGVATANNCMMFPQILPLAAACLSPYVGPAPGIVHLHGGEVPAKADGGPLGWFTPTGTKGSGYRTHYNAGPGTQVNLYQNTQEPGTLWFHDHVMGQTRTNVYSGMAAFYFLREPENEPANLPSGAQEIEMAIQDRQFDTTGQLFFPDGSGADAATSNLNGTPPNPDNHPFWNPEFVGDVVIVNGAPWPFLNVEPKRYRFRLLDGSNARAYKLFFGAAPVYVIGTDDSYLDAPVPVNSVLMLPGQRRDVIVDFTNLAGQTFSVFNNAQIPFPEGLIPGVDQPGMDRIIRFTVAPAVTTPDTSCNPAVAGQCTRPAPLVKLTDGAGNIAPGVVIDKVRRLVLKEFQGAGGPLDVFINNGSFDGTTSPSIKAVFPSDGISERPRQGSVELWEIINLTVDGHPIHTHLAQFQVLNREAFNTDPVLGYPPVWENAFPAAPAFSPVCTGHVFCPGYGPPNPYTNVVRDEAFLTPFGNPAIIGGNPSIAPFLSGAPTPPDSEEVGWQDTARSMPGEVLRILVRFNPTDTPLINNVSLKGVNLYPFDPTDAPHYVWHCHIIDHEDNDMMLKYRVMK
jgi:spore coat protein A, manganese oxidase